MVTKKLCNSKVQHSAFLKISSTRFTILVPNGGGVLPTRSSKSPQLSGGFGRAIGLFRGKWDNAYRIRDPGIGGTVNCVGSRARGDEYKIAVLLIVESSHCDIL